VFFRKTGSAGLAALLAALAIASCARRPSSTVERLAVLPLENLGSGSELDWAGRAAAAAIVYDLDGLADQYPQTVDSISSAYSMHASRVLEGYYLERNGRAQITATLESLEGRKTIETIQIEGSLANGIVPLVNQLAKRLNPQARSFGTGNMAAFRAYGDALAAGDRAAALQDLGSATQADPGFGAAYIAEARLLVAAGDRDQARQVIRSGEARRPDAIDRAKLEYLSASDAHDAQARIKALDALARLTPADPSVVQEKGELELQRRDFQDCARDYEAASRLNPNEPENWNQLGYVLAYAGDLAGARQALDRYQRLLPPQNANALDSLGEINFYLGDFAEAAGYFLQAQQKNPGQFRGAELLKAAEANLMTGNLAEADALFQKYLGSSPSSQPARAGVDQAQWEFLTGRHKAAMARLEHAIPQLDSEARSLGLSQLSIWKLETGDSQAAALLAGEAAQAAVSPQNRALSTICRFLATRPADKSGSPVVDAYALIFARNFQGALPLLESLYAETNPARDGQVRTLLAWAYVETGKIAEADRLLRLYPIPLSSGESVLASLTFPRYLFLKGAALEKDGQRAEAKQSYQLFLKYAGDLPDIFGDETTARQRLGAL